MRGRRALLTAVATLAVAGCGGGTADDPAAPAAATTPSRPDPAAPPASAAPPVASGAYLDALEGYCTATVRAVERLARSPADARDPAAPVATFARRYRAGLEELAALQPPAALRRLHLLIVAQGRESADRLDDGVRLGRTGDTDAATTALGEIEGLLPSRLPRSVRRGAPACARALGG